MSSLIDLINLLLLFLLPLGHEQLRQRIPKVTLGLIIINTVIYFTSFSLQVFQIVPMIGPEMELAKSEAPLVKTWAEKQGEEDPEKKLEKMSPRDRAQWECEFHRALEAGEVVPRDSEEYLEWHQARLKFLEKRDRMMWFRFGFRPEAPDLVSAFTYMFLHASFWHLFWNMYYLWLVGCNWENVWSRKYFLALYLAGGLAADLADYLVRAGGCWADLPGIGASGAISAVMGAFLIRFWNTRLRFLFITRVFSLPVWLPLGAWFARQLYYGLYYFNENASTNFWAHIGGFAFGMAVAAGFSYFQVEPRRIAKELRHQDERDWQKSAAARAAKKEADRPQDLVLGIEARKVGWLDEAREHLLRAATDFPLNLDVHFELQQVLQRMGRVEEANAHQGVIIGALLELGHTEDALARYRLLQQVAPEATAPGRNQYRLARLLEERREWLLAAQAYRAFAAKEPEDELAPKALYSAGVLLLNKLRQPEPAYALLDYLHRRYPGHAIQEHVQSALEALRTRQGKKEP